MLQRIGSGVDFSFHTRIEEPHSRYSNISVAPLLNGLLQGDCTVELLDVKVRVSEYLMEFHYNGLYRVKLCTISSPPPHTVCTPRFQVHIASSWLIMAPRRVRLTLKQKFAIANECAQRNVKEGDGIREVCTWDKIQLKLTAEPSYSTVWRIAQDIERITHRNKDLPDSRKIQLMFSNGWFESFKKSNKFKCFKNHIECGDADTTAITPELPALRFRLAQYRSCDIFNADECVLYYRQPPTVTIEPVVCVVVKTD